MANGLTIHDEIQIFKDVFPRFSLSTPFLLPSVVCFPSPPHLRHECLKSMVKLKEWTFLSSLTEGVKGGRPALNSPPCVTNACNYICGSRPKEIQSLNSHHKSVSCHCMTELCSQKERCKTEVLKQRHWFGCNCLHLINYLLGYQPCCFLPPSQKP